MSSCRRIAPTEGPPIQLDNPSGVGGGIAQAEPDGVALAEISPGTEARLALTDDSKPHKLRVILG
jgi:hypothetical protein